jgi:hypothetical protein
MFRLDKLTQKAQEAVQQAQAVAEKNENQVMFPLHLLIAGFALYEAWKLNRGVALQVTGPYQAATRPAVA